MSITSKVTQKPPGGNMHIVRVPKKLEDLGFIVVGQVYEAKELKEALEYRRTEKPFNPKNKWMSKIRANTAGQMSLTIYARVARKYILAQVAEWRIEKGKAVMWIAATEKNDLFSYK